MTTASIPRCNSTPGLHFITFENSARWNIGAWEWHFLGENAEVSANGAGEFTSDIFSEEREFDRVCLGQRMDSLRSGVSLA